MNKLSIERTSVAIVGGGPNGVAMANMLGLYGIQTVVVEKAPTSLSFHAPLVWTTKLFGFPDNGSGG